MENHLSAEALTISTKESKDRCARNAKSTMCSFCDGCHWTDEFRKYRTIEELKGSAIYAEGLETELKTVEL
jgi:hypothetical protein